MLEGVKGWCALERPGKAEHSTAQGGSRTGPAQPTPRPRSALPSGTAPARATPRALTANFAPRGLPRDARGADLPLAAAWRAPGRAAGARAGMSGPNGDPHVPGGGGSDGDRDGAGDVFGEEGACGRRTGAIPVPLWVPNSCRPAPCGCILVPLSEARSVLCRPPGRG